MYFHQLLFIILNCTIFSLQISDEFIKIKNSIEQKVTQIADAVQKKYKNYKNQSVSIQFPCQYKSYDYCDGTSERYCLANFPSPQNCFNGMKYSLTSGVRIPNSVTLYDMSEQMKYFLCKTAEPNVSELLQNITKNNKNQHSWAFFGSNQGILRVSPMKKADKQQQTVSCENYDTRLRPWYAQNVFRSKKMIILIENSRRIHEEPNRFLSIQMSIQALLKTAEESDQINIIQFSDQAQPLFEKKQLKLFSLKQEKQSFFNVSPSEDFYQSLTNNFTKSNQTKVNYHQAINLSLQILANSKKQNPDFQNLILMFSGFAPTNLSSSTFDQLSELIQTKSLTENLRIFFFAFGVNYNSLDGKKLLKQLTCRFNGVYLDLDDISIESMFLDQAKGYYEYLIQNNDIPYLKWSSAYDDNLGLGKTITVTKSVYKNDRNLTRLIGVAGIDVLVSQINDLLNSSQIYDLYEQSEKFQAPFKFNISFCVLQRIRGKNSCANTCPKTFPITKKLSPSNQTIFQQPIDDSQNLCCSDFDSNEIDQTLGIVLGIFIPLITLSFGIYCIFFRKKLSEKIQNKYKDIFRVFTNFDHTRIQQQAQISQIND